MLRETHPPPGGCKEMNFSACQRKVLPQGYFRDSAKRNRSRRTFRSWSSRKISLGRAAVTLHVVTMVSSRKPFDLANEARYRCGCADRCFEWPLVAQVWPQDCHEISWKVGYEDPGAFRRVFQKIIGLSPGEYRRRFGIADRQQPERRIGTPGQGTPRNKFRHLGRRTCCRRNRLRRRARLEPRCRARHTLCRGGD